MRIRAETPGDEPAIRAVLEAAFPSSAEADLVGRLRHEGDAAIALLGIVDGAVAGHALFSRLRAPFRALGLAPVAVLPRHQRAGLGSRLIREGLAQAWRQGWEGVFVLGDPDFYGRFGFAAEAAAGFASPYAGRHLMAVAPGCGDLPARCGEIAYPPAFAALG